MLLDSGAQQRGFKSQQGSRSQCDTSVSQKTAAIEPITEQIRLISSFCAEKYLKMSQKHKTKKINS